MIKNQNNTVGRTEPTYEPDFLGRFIKVRPAIGTFHDKAYFVLWIPTKIVYEEDNKSGKNRYEDIAWMLTSDGKRIRWDQKELMIHGLVPESGIEHYDLRWDLNDSRCYLNNPSNENPQLVFKKIVGEMKKYIDYPDDRYFSLISLWIMGTYFQPLFQSYPFLYFGGVKRVGKTKSLTFVSQLSFNSINSLSVSVSALFRLCQSSASTLLVDETGYLRNKARFEDLRTLLYGRYKRGQTVQRVEKDSSGKFMIKHFQVFGPTALANIEGLEDVLADRCISIIMRRSVKRDILNSEMDEKLAVFQETRNMLYRLWMTHFKEVEELSSVVSVENAVSEYSDYKEQVSGRAWELWKPIIVLAKFIDKYDGQGKPILADIVKLAEESEKIRKVEDATETAESTLVYVLSQNVKVDGWYSVRWIKELLSAQMEDVNFINNRWIGRVMTRLSFNEKRRIGTGIEYRLTPEKIEDLAERLNIPYTPASTQTTQTAQTSLGERWS